MTVVPHPGVPARLGPEVRLAVVVDLGGEAEEAAVGAGVGVVSAAGETVLLMGTLQSVHGPVLQVGGLLHSLRAENQVRGRWEGDFNSFQFIFSESICLFNPPKMYLL